MPPVHFAPAPPWDVASTPAAARRGFRKAALGAHPAALGVWFSTSSLRADSEELRAFVSDAPALRRAAAVVRDRRHVLDGLDVEAAGGESADGRLAARARSLDLHVDGADAVLLRELRRVLRRHLRGERSALARSLEADAPRARPRQDVSHRVADGHDRVVERRGDRGHAVRNVLPLLLLRSRAAGAGFRCSCSSHVQSLFLRCFLLAGDGALAGALPRARVRVRSLPADGQSAAVAHAAVAVDLHQPLDVEADVLAEVSLDFALVGDDLADPPDLVLGKVFPARVAVHLGLAEDVGGARTADAEDVGEAHFHALVQWEIDACDTCHGSLIPVSAYASGCRK